MNAATRARVLAILNARRAMIASRWYAAIADTGFTPLRASEVHAALEALTGRAIAALVNEPFDRPEAQAIGTELAAELHYVSAGALEGTLAVLGQELLVGLPPVRARALGTRLPMLLGAMAGGFFIQSRAMILEGQEEVRRALFVTRQQAEAAEQARATAEAAVRVRNEVLSAAAHDLRAPLTSILGQADMMRLYVDRGSQTPDWMRARLDAIRGGALRIGAMVDELLDVARLQMGQALELQIEPVDLGALARSVAAEMPGQAGAERVVVEAPDEPVVVDGDAARLARVLQNVIGNGLKYSQSTAPVQVTVRRQGAQVVVGVRDRGVGIPREEQPHVFTPFYRASTSQGFAGTGIGLAGAKSIVEQHGGTIALQSAVGQGTTVVITLHSAERL